MARLVMKMYQGRKVEVIQGMKFKEPGWAAIFCDGKALRVRRSELSKVPKK